MMSFVPRHVCRPFKTVDFGSFDNKLAILGLRCQSLLYLKLYKMRRHELKECQKILGDHIQKAELSSTPSSSSAAVSPINAEIPSPAGSENSKSSGYTSAGEQHHQHHQQQHHPGQTIPCLSVPLASMQKQHMYCSYLSQCHDLWEKADMYAHRGHCEGLSRFYIYRVHTT